MRTIPVQAGRARRAPGSLPAVPQMATPAPSRSERPGAQARHVGRTWPRSLPAETAVLFRYLDVVDAGLAPAHQAVLVEFPLLVAVGAMPLATLVAPFVLKAHGDAVVVEGPEVLDQAVVEL